MTPRAKKKKPPAIRSSCCGAEAHWYSFIPEPTAEYPWFRTACRFCSHCGKPCNGTRKEDAP